MSCHGLTKIRNPDLTLRAELALRDIIGQTSGAVGGVRAQIA
jgi:hypothetical protein